MFRYFVLTLAFPGGIPGLNPFIEHKHMWKWDHKDLIRKQYMYGYKTNLYLLHLVRDMKREIPNKKVM